jgi:N6-adenosine-specific RNA methylase IME4
VPRLMVSPRREHSRKPDETHGRVERLVPGPYLEMFSRTDRAGWDCWGAEAGHFARQELRKKVLHNDLEAAALI